MEEPNLTSLLTVQEAAKALRTHPSTIYRWIDRGEIQAIRYGRTCTCGTSARGGAIRIPESAVTDFLRTSEITRTEVA